MIRLICFIFTISIYLTGSTQTVDTLIADKFNNNTNQWPVQNSDNYSLSIESGVYKFVNQKKNAAFASKKEIFLDTEKDFIIEADLTLESKRFGVEYGIIWGANDSCEYNFLLDAEGRFCVQQWTGNYVDFLIQWSAVDAIKIGVGQTNHLSVRKENLNLKFYINNHYVGRVAFREFFGHYTGFLAGNKVKLTIDSFLVIQKENRFPDYRQPGKLMIDTAYFITTGDDDVLNIDEKGYLIVRLKNKSSTPSHDVEVLLVPIDSPDDIYYDNVLSFRKITNEKAITFAFEFEPTYFMSSSKRKFRVLITEANATDVLTYDVGFSTTNKFTPVPGSPTPNQKNKYLEIFIVGVPLFIFALVALF